MGTEQIVIPGMRICAAEDDQYISGPGTYSLHGYIYSSLAGKLRLTPKTIRGMDAPLIWLHVQSAFYKWLILKS